MKKIGFFFCIHLFHDDVKDCNIVTPIIDLTFAYSVVCDDDAG